MRRFCVMALVFLASAFSFATVSVSGNLVNPATGSVSSRAFVRFWIRGCGGNQARVSGTGVILPSFTDLTPTAGAISGTLYDSLTEISCGGSIGATWYGVQAYYDGKPGPEVPYNVTGASFNLNSATPNTTSPVVSAPTGDSTYQRLDGGNIATGSYVPNANGTLNLGSSPARWNIFAHTISTDSSTVVANLNSSQLLGSTWAAPAAIGTGTPLAGTFTTLTGNTSVTSALFKSSTANPAGAGVIRLAKTDALNFRNNANGADLNGLSLDSSDRTVVGDSAGIVVGGGTVNSSSAITVQPSSSCNHCAVTVSASASASGTGGSVNVTATDASSGVTAGGSVNLTVGTGFGGGSQGKVNFGNGKLGTYNSLTTVGYGLPPIVAKVQSTGLVASVSPATLISPSADSTYEVCYNAYTTTSGTGTTVLVSIIWSDGNAKTFASGTAALNSVTVTGQVNGCQFIHAQSASNVQYSTTVGSIGSSVYALDVWVKQVL